MRRLPRIVVALWISGVAACGLLNEPDDLSREFGRTEPADGATGPDVSGPIAEAGNDTGPATDGGADANRFCPRGDAMLCDDFDDPPSAPLGSRWSRVPVLDPDSGTFLMELQTQSATSTPNALYVRASTNRISDTEGPSLVFDDPVKKGHVRISFTMQIDSLDPTARGRLVDYQAGVERLSLACTTDRKLEIQYVDAMGQLKQYPVDADAGTDLQGPLDVVLDLQFDENLFTLRIGKDIKVTQNPSALQDTTKPVVRFGIPVFVSVQPIAVRYDNVVIE